jgi:hypothetical protein
LFLSEEIALVIKERTREACRKTDKKNLIIGIEKNAAAAGAGIEVLDKN